MYGMDVVQVCSNICCLWSVGLSAISNFKVSNFEILNFQILIF